MHTEFYKYHGAGNDFILIDNRANRYSDISAETIRQICSRRFGIGSDGLILLSRHDSLDFQMDYFNPDGSGATFCGNGARCIAAFAHKLGLINERAKFMASDGEHTAFIEQDTNKKKYTIRLQMNDVDNFSDVKEGVFCHTGSPHLVCFAEDVQKVSLPDDAQKIRFSDAYKEPGINVNFVSEGSGGDIFVRTYERGVEAETLSCGTGVTASALAYARRKKTESLSREVRINTAGGMFRVGFRQADDIFSEVYLTGPVDFVYSGIIEL